MPFGSDHDPPGWREKRTLSFIEQLMYNLLSVMATVTGLGRSVAVSIFQAVQSEQQRKYPNVPLSPATLAAAVVKGYLSQDDAAGEASRSGMAADRFAVAVDTTGNPPGPGELLDQWRRGLIDDATFAKGIRQGYLRVEWLDFYRALRHVPLSPREYLQAAVQGYLTLAEAKGHADLLGLADADAQLVYDLDGEPPGPQEMLHLWNRGLMTEADVDQGFRESRYKNKYIPLLKHLREYLPPPRTITTLLAHGAISQDVAQGYFVKAGLSPELAAAYVASAVHIKTASHKELAVGTVKSLYADRVIMRDQAVADLGKVGYASAEANLILDLADAQARQKIQNASVAAVKHLYVTKRTDDAGAHASLAKLGLDAGHTGDLIELWSLERGVPNRTLTIGQLNSAYKKGLLTEAQFVTRAMDLGFDRADADLLASIDVPPATP